MNRPKKPSPFPQAYKVIVDIQRNSEVTAKFTVGEELLAACRAIDGAVCHNCNATHETGLSWELHRLLDEDGQHYDTWICKLCQKKNSDQLTDYSYSEKTLDSGTEHLKLPRSIRFKKPW